MQIKLGKVLVWLTFTLQLLPAYTLQMHVDNLRPTIGEKVTLTVDFIYDNIEEYEVKEATFENAETTLVSDDEFRENNQTHNRIVYTLRAQKSGTYALHPLQAHIEMIPPAYQERYNKNKYLKKFDISSNALTLEVQPLPQSLRVWGNYTIHSSVDKVETTVGKPLLFTVTLQGKGNIKNLDFVTLDISHVLIYEKNHALSKQFSIVAEKSFTIPSVALTYFNQEKQMIESIRTESYHITVTGTSVKKSKNIGVSVLLLSIYLSLFYAVSRIFKTLAFIDEKQMLFKRIKKAKNKKELLKIISPYMFESKGLERMVYRLEKSEESAFKKIKKETTTQMHLLTHESNKFI